MSNTIDLASIKAGGKISLTLNDGTRIIDSPVTYRGGSLFCAGSCKRVLDLSNPDESVGTNIATIDAYTPPKPVWDTPDVYAVRDFAGDVWIRDIGDTWTCVTVDRAQGVHANPSYQKWSSDKMEQHYGGAIKPYATAVTG
jgi:hypothetical protein